MAVWRVDEKHLIALIRELARVGRRIAELDGKTYWTFFASRLPDIVLDMLGLPADYYITPEPEELLNILQGRAPSDKGCPGYNHQEPMFFNRNPYYEMFAEKAMLNDDTAERLLAQIRQNRREFERIRRRQRENGLIVDGQ